MSADCTQFYAGEPKETVLTVYAPADIVGGTIYITDDYGKQVCEIDSEQMQKSENGFLSASATVKISSKKDGAGL